MGAHPPCKELKRKRKRNNDSGGRTYDKFCLYKEGITTKKMGGRKRVGEKGSKGLILHGKGNGSNYKHARDYNY